MRMRRTVLLLASVALAVLLASGAAWALPAETPDDTPMVNGPVRAVEQVGASVWVGGNFSEVRRRDGSLVDRVDGAAVFDSATGEYVDGVAPDLGGDVMDMAVYGTNVVIAGSFPGPSSTKKNLVAVDGATGAVVGWHDAPKLKSVLAAPGLGRVYGGGVSLSAFDFATGKRLWTRARTTVDPSLRTHAVSAAHRDLELDGSTIWSACVCDAVDGNPAKALVKLSAEGVHDPYWSPAGAGPSAFGISVVQYGGALYLGAGGSDFLAAHYKADGKRQWVRDTSGSAQVVEIADGQLVVGGHFWEVADGGGDRCGFRSSNNAATLDPYGECQTRKGLAAYTFGGVLDPWNPKAQGGEEVWALHADGTRLHVGGDFRQLNDTDQTYYARLSS